MSDCESTRSNREMRNRKKERKKGKETPKRNEKKIYEHRRAIFEIREPNISTDTKRYSK